MSRPIKVRSFYGCGQTPRLERDCQKKLQHTSHEQNKVPATRQRVVVNIYVYVYCIHFSKFYAIYLFCLFVRVLGRVDSEVNLRPLRNLCILFVIYIFFKYIHNK